MKTGILSLVVFLAVCICGLMLCSCGFLDKSETVKTTISRLGITGEPETVTTETPYVAPPTMIQQSMYEYAKALADKRRAE